jgi:hypothetical protein
MLRVKHEPQWLLTGAIANKQIVCHWPKAASPSWPAERPVWVVRRRQRHWPKVRFFVASPESRQSANGQQRSLQVKRARKPAARMPPTDKPETRAPANIITPPLARRERTNHRCSPYLASCGGIKAGCIRPPFFEDTSVQVPPTRLRGVEQIERGMLLEDGRCISRASLPYLRT